MLSVILHVSVVWLVSASHKTLSSLACRLMGVSLCISVCGCGVVCATFPHLSAGCPSLIALEAPLVPTVLIDVTQYCVGRQGLLFCNGNMLITTPFSPQKREIALLGLCGSDWNWWRAKQMSKIICVSGICLQKDCLCCFWKQGSLNNGVFLEWIWIRSFMRNGSEPRRTKCTNFLHLVVLELLSGYTVLVRLLKCHRPAFGKY